MAHSVKFLKPVKSEFRQYYIAFCHTKLYNKHTVSHYVIPSVLTLRLPYNETVTCNGNSHPRKLKGHNFTSGQLTSYFSLQARNCVPTLLGWWVSRRTCLTVQQTSTWCLCHIHTLQVKEYHTHNMQMSDIFLHKLMHSNLSLLQDPLHYRHTTI